VDNRSTFIESTDLVFVPNKGTEAHLAQEGRELREQEEAGGRGQGEQEEAGGRGRKEER